MYKIGITGSIGTGKTTIANLFALFNVPIFDADKEIKKILAREKIKQRIKRIWPKVIKNDEIEKSKLKTIIFSDKKEKKRLEELLYPYLEIEKEKFNNANHAKKIIVYDVPLIYETKSEEKYDLILLANCNKTLQKKRVLMRDKISNALFDNIIKSQLSFDEKMKFKPKVFNTGNFKIFILIKVVLLIIKVHIGLEIKK